MNVYINNKKLTVPESCSVKTVLETLTTNSESAPHPGACAIVVNQNFIPRSLYPVTLLKENDNIEFISPMQGG